MDARTPSPPVTHSLVKRAARRAKRQPAALHLSEQTPPRLGADPPPHQQAAAQAKRGQTAGEQPQDLRSRPYSCCTAGHTSPSISPSSRQHATVPRTCFTLLQPAQSGASREADT